MGRKLTAIIGTLTLAVLCQLLPSWAAAQTKVSLGSVDNLYGIATQGVAITGGGIDNGSGGGSAYAGSLLGTSLSYNGVSFTIPAPGPNTAVQSKTISLPAGKFNTLSFLGAAVNGNQQNQAFIVKYTDGTSKTFTQSLSDWGGTPGGFAGESTVITTAFKILANGTTHNGSYKLYGYSFTLDSTRTVASFAMPANRNVVMLALDLIANKATAASPTFSPLPGTFTSAPTLTLASATPGASIFFTTNGTTPTTSSTKYTAPFKVAATETIKAIAKASGFTTSAVVSGVYTINASATPTATPTFSPKAGTYATPQSVSLSDATSGASIFFTTDGTTPTAASSKYTGAFEVSKTTTVKALGVASGHTNSAVASATYTISLSAPSGLSYPVPPTLLIGNAVSLTPSVTGSVTSYTVSPALPHGLALNATSGLITGKPTSVTAAATYTVKAANAAGSTTFALPLKVDSGPTVHLTATASTATGATLTYTWKTTDGKLLNTNGSQTDWELPAGFGLHFGYVMVSDGRSGYAVGRVVVNTDSFGAAQVIPIGLVETPVRPVAAALAPVRAGRAAAAPEAVPDERKPSVLFAAAPGAAAPGAARAVNPLTSSALTVSGSVELGDHNLAGITEPFFNVQVSPTVSLTTSTCLSDADCPSAVSTAKFGEFSLTANDPGPLGTTVTVDALSQSAGLATASFTLTQADLNNGHLLAPLLLGNTATPALTNITATYNGTAVGAFQLDWPNPSGQPSDGYPQQNWFLSYLGGDSKKSSCAYYLAVGAVTGCDANGNFSGAINFTQWQKQVQIDQFTPAGEVTTRATYVNVVDLNLTRSHHSILHPNAGGTATYVCNYAGPVDANGKPVTVNLPASTITPAQQTAVNNAVDNAIAGKNLVACVAMDYLSTPINDFAQFTRFLVFGPSGQLLPSVNLDGRGEKFLPGTCVACHGGDNYAGQYPSDGSGVPDIGAHFLPYDAGNFAFSNKAGLTDAAQEEAIYQLNQNILSTDATAATTNLVFGWYQNGHVLNQNYVPTAWSAHADVYKSVVARSCRTCHAAVSSSFDWDSIGPGDPAGTVGGTLGFTAYASDVCDAGTLTGSQDMPNSKVTFDRMWDSAGTSVDQIAKLTALYHSFGFLPSNKCVLRKAPH